MNDSAFNLESTAESSLGDETPPEFGLVDIVEAFTAMRHEWRGQTRESRALAEVVQAAVDTIQGLERDLVDSAAAGSTDESRKLAELIAEIDQQFTRCVAAVLQSEENHRLREESDARAIELFFERMPAVSRWFARPLLTFLSQQRQARVQTAENPAVEGLNLVLARLRRTMKELQIERVETLGQPFDPNTMNAIGTLESPDHPSGHVAEQLSPCYLRHGRLLRFADVRVTPQRAPGDGLPAASA